MGVFFRVVPLFATCFSSVALALNTLCNYPWISADLLSHALVETFTAQYPQLFSLGTGSASFHFSSTQLSHSDEQFDFIRGGRCDIGVECWQYENRRCDDQPGIAFRRHEDLFGEEGIYIPKWLGERNPELLEFPGGYAAGGGLPPTENGGSSVPADLQILGVPTSFAAEKGMRCFTKDWRDSILVELGLLGAGKSAPPPANSSVGTNFSGPAVNGTSRLAFCRAVGVPDYFYQKMLFSDDETALTKLVLEALRMRIPTLFYYWTPNLLPAAYDVVRVARFGNRVPLFMVWRDEHVPGGTQGPAHVVGKSAARSLVPLLQQKNQEDPPAAAVASTALGDPREYVLGHTGSG